jgi:hypothetical protein
MEDSRIEQCIGAIARHVGHALVAGFAAPRSVVFLAGARRKRAGQRFDASARHVDHRDRGHAHHCALEQAVAKRLSVVLVARHPERATHILPPGVARGSLLRELLQRGIDGDVDGKTDVDRRAAPFDAVRTVAVAGRRVVLTCHRVGIEPIQRARRTPQRSERLQHDIERRRNLPPWIIHSEGGHGFTRDGDWRDRVAFAPGGSEKLRTRAKRFRHRARAAHEICRHSNIAGGCGVTHEDATG